MPINPPNQLVGIQEGFDPDKLDGTQRNTNVPHIGNIEKKTGRLTLD